MRSRSRKRYLGLAGVASAAVLAAGLVTATTVSGQEGEELPVIGISPASGEPGTVITVQSTDDPESLCTDGESGGTVTLELIGPNGPVVTVEGIQANNDGSWQGTIKVPEEDPPKELTVLATCFLVGGEPVTLGAATFSVTPVTVTVPTTEKPTTDTKTTPTTDTPTTPSAPSATTPPSASVAPATPATPVAAEPGFTG